MAKNAGSKKHYSVNSAAFIAKRSIYTKNKDRLCKNSHIYRETGRFDIDTEEI